MKVRGRLGTRSSTSKADERNEFISSSFATSRLLSERIFAWSGSNSRGRLFPIKFQRYMTFRERNCPVMRWYKQQCSSSTRFRTIEHRRNMDGPFYHEFLLLRLTDGAVCRVERTGDGSRADAIRYSGCTANDLIQWFSAEDYARFSAEVPSELVAEVELSRKFDIMDVLAVCYSIQKVKASRVYTLQRYNCYFFCWAILAVLTRRIASWETMIRSRTWDSELDSIIRRLSKLPPEESRSRLLLRICMLLDPNSSRPTAPLLNPLRTHLSSKAGALLNLNKALSTILWAASCELALQNGLADAVTAAGKVLLAHRGSCGTQLRRAMRPTNPMTEQENRVLTKLIKNVYLAEASGFLTRLTRDLSHQFQRMEAGKPVPLIRSAFYGLAACGDSLAFLIGRDPRYLRRGLGFALDSFKGRLLLCKLVAVIGRAWRLHRFVGDDRYPKIFQQLESQLSDKLQAKSVMRIFDAFETEYTIDRHELLHILNQVLSEQFFFRQLGLFTRSVFAPVLEAMLRTNQTQVVVKLQYPETLRLSQDIRTVAQFQEKYLHPRIQAHAKRVADHQLAAAPLVYEDILDTMENVWKSLPEGFGGHYGNSYNT